MVTTEAPAALRWPPVLPPLDPPDTTAVVDTPSALARLAEIKRLGHATPAVLRDIRKYLDRATVLPELVPRLTAALATLDTNEGQWLRERLSLRASRDLARRGKPMTTDDTTAPLTADERATMKATVGSNAARAEAARVAHATAWQAKMAPVRARLVAAKTTLHALAEAHRTEITDALATVRELTEARLTYKSVGVLRSFRSLNVLGAFDNAKPLQALIERIDGVTDAEAQNPTVAPALTARANLLCGGVTALPAQLAAFRQHYRALMDAEWKPQTAVLNGTIPEQRKASQAFATSSTARPRGAA